MEKQVSLWLSVVSSLLTFKSNSILWLMEVAYFNGCSGSLFVMVYLFLVHPSISTVKVIHVKKQKNMHENYDIIIRNDNLYIYKPKLGLNCNNLLWDIRILSLYSLKHKKPSNSFMIYFSGSKRVFGNSDGKPTCQNDSWSGTSCFGMVSNNAVRQTSWRATGSIWVNQGMFSSLCLSLPLFLYVYFCIFISLCLSVCSSISLLAMVCTPFFFYHRLVQMVGNLILFQLILMDIMIYHNTWNQLQREWGLR